MVVCEELMGSEEVEIVILGHSLKKFGKTRKPAERQIQERKEIIVGIFLKCLN